jgi:hypothetical protein
MGPQRQSRAVALALHCYPKRWKVRHGEEATELAQRLASDGVPAASIAFSYLGGAVRARVAPLATRRWRARASVLVAAASVAAMSVALSTSPAPAGAAGVVRIEITDRSDAVSDLTSSFRLHHFSIAVRQVSVPASQVGSIVTARVTGPAASRDVIGEIKGLCANGSMECNVGVVIPANFTGNATVLVGRSSCPPVSTAKILAGNKVTSNKVTGNKVTVHKPNSNEAGLSDRPC